MISAEEARGLSALPGELEKIEKVILSNASKGDEGVWMNVSDNAKAKLEELGFEVDVTELDGTKTKTWIYWGS